MTNKEALDIINAVKEYSYNDESIVYPLVSYMCQVGYLKKWKCIDDVFYMILKTI